MELNSRNFDELVLKSKDLWVVEFFAPWCGHCKKLAPEWKKAANSLKGQVKLGHVDCDADKVSHMPLISGHIVSPNITNSSYIKCYTLLFFSCQFSIASSSEPATDICFLQIFANQV